MWDVKQPTNNNNPSTLFDDFVNWRYNSFEMFVPVEFEPTPVDAESLPFS